MTRCHLQGREFCQSNEGIATTLPPLMVEFNEFVALPVVAWTKWQFFRIIARPSSLSIN